ncbi:Putative conjugative transfer signal peptidase TraF [Desulfonema limicola]|uniref:Conjugative transfer signal peptidase TraF n=1 Tax=Desulfonema limicola TaxID=45656 RepID=A0A975B481_9BACT|nr:S26 family signal peptidase [Desulfonema limicola]QTA78505.1 Putative conjugative transfer signal peptidase TraF [Desulfonema limicola]
MKNMIVKFFKTNLREYFTLETLKNSFSPGALKKRFSLKKLIISLLIPAFLAVLYALSPIGFGAALDTKSVNCQAFLYHKKPYPHPPVKDDYVLFRFKEGDLSPEYYDVFKDMRLIKKVGCAPGSFLECQFNTCRCDGMTIVNSIAEKFSSQVWTYSGVIPPGQIFLIGDHDSSYDGRYWGLVPEANLVGVVNKCLMKRKPE